MGDKEKRRQDCQKYVTFATLEGVGDDTREGEVERVAQNSRDSFNASVDCVRAGGNTSYASVLIYYW